MTRGSPAVVIVPKAAEPTVVFGAPNGVNSYPLFFELVEPRTGSRKSAGGGGVSYQPAMMVSTFRCVMQAGSAVLFPGRQGYPDIARIAGMC
jgi:hypothetical protein